MEKITPHLWYDKEANEAAQLYMSIFPDSKKISGVTLHDTPSGDADVVTIELAGQEFTLLNGGPLFKFNPSISFMVCCDSKEEVEELWGKLNNGGEALMELGEYSFSEKYGWTADKFGLSWQIMYMGERPITQKIIPTFMFVGDVCGQAEEAINHYISIFKNSEIGPIMRYPAGPGPDKEGTIMHAGFSLEGQDFAAMDSAVEHGFQFNEAISLMVHCETQEEIDYYWDKLTAVPESEQCGWLKDKFGVSWQIVPTAMDKMFAQQDPAKMARVTEAFLKMKKFNIAELEKAADSD
jgi:predicted 3-demethylubiquinone-9 3-methyltransferase (glyoxalase superfamily)